MKTKASSMSDASRCGQQSVEKYQISWQLRFVSSCLLIGVFAEPFLPSRGICRVLTHALDPLCSCEPCQPYCRHAFLKIDDRAEHKSDYHIDVVRDEFPDQYRKLTGTRRDEQQASSHQFEKNHIDHWMTDTLSISNRFHFSELLTKTGFGVRR